jgi:CheY-like chemotaxis protein
VNTSHIVLIEDNPADVLLVEKALEANVTYEMTQFNNGVDALQVLCAPAETAANTFVPDAILLDLNTPKSDGFNVLVRLKNTPHLAEVPVAIITSSKPRATRADPHN